MRAAVIGTLLLGAGCTGPVPSADPPAANRTTFNNQVYGVLLRDCGFPECHGSLSESESRFFRVYGPGRTRLDPATDPLDPYTEDERTFTYERARSMLASADSAAETLLVRKPLNIQAGGAPHMGRDVFGGDVYATTEAEGYQALLGWARTAIPEAGP